MCLIIRRDFKNEIWLYLVKHNSFRKQINSPGDQQSILHGDKKENNCSY